MEKIVSHNVSSIWKKLCGGRDVTSDARRRSPEPLGIGRMLVRQLVGSPSGAFGQSSEPCREPVGEPCRVTRRAASGRAGAFGRVICPSAACLSLDVFGCNADRKSSGRRHGAPIIINYIDSCSGHQLLSTFHHVFCERMCTHPHTHTNTVKSHGTVITLSRAASCRGRFRGREG